MAVPDVPRDPFVPLDERCSAMLAFVGRQRRLIDHALALFMENDHSSPTARVLFPMLWATGNTCAGLERISEAVHFRESYVLGRGLVESVVNMLFIVAEGDEAARRAERHASQKAFRDLDRLSKVAGEQIRIRLGDEVLSPPSEGRGRDRRVHHKGGLGGHGLDARIRGRTNRSHRSKVPSTNPGRASLGPRRALSTRLRDLARDSLRSAIRPRYHAPGRSTGPRTTEESLQWIPHDGAIDVGVRGGRLRQRIS